MARRLEWSIDYTSENWQDVTASAEMGALACSVFLASSRSAAAARGSCTGRSAGTAAP